MREVAEFVNLRSMYRGSNRFPALLKTFELLRTRPGVAESGVQLPSFKALDAYCKSGVPLGNESLKEEVERTGDPELTKVFDWSLAVNDDIERNMEPAEPFAYAVETLEKMSEAADVVVISQTPREALLREWRHYDIERYVRVIAGQEQGSKAEQIQSVARDKYSCDKMLFIGDALGDSAAACETGIDFFPIIPGAEVESWRLLKTEALEKFLAGEFHGSYGTKLTESFIKSLPAEMD